MIKVWIVVAITTISLVLAIFLVPSFDAWIIAG